MNVVGFVTNNKFIEHKINSLAEPAITAVKYEYLLAGNGLFIRAKRREFSVCLPIAPLEVNGVPPAGPRIVWEKPPIPVSVWRGIIDNARDNCETGSFREDVFAIFWTDEGWQWERIGRERRVASVVADDSGAAYRDACIEIHTHPAGALDFSVADDRDETGKFRIFGLIAGVHSPNPLIRFRCGIYEYFCPIPAVAVGEMPNGVLDLTLIDAAVKRGLR